MSYPDANNPFASPQVPKEVPVAPLPAGPVQMEYLRSYNYIFENPNWMMNVLWGFLCILSSALVPVIGQLLFMGYQYEVIEALCLNRGSRYPDFDINRFTEYLGRSIWPFLVSLIVVLPLIVLLYGGMIVAVLLGVAAAAAGGDDIGPVIGMVVGVFGFVVVMGLFMVVMALVTPMILRAGLQQEFGAAFDFGWAMDFLKKTWMELILSSLFLGFSGIIVIGISALALCVGMYAGIAVMMLAQAHMWYQLYMIFLSRGGAPIPFKPQAPQVPPAGFAPPQY